MAISICSSEVVKFPGTNSVFTASVENSFSRYSLVGSLSAVCRAFNFASQEANILRFSSCVSIPAACRPALRDFTFAMRSRTGTRRASECFEISSLILWAA